MQIQVVNDFAHGPHAFSQAEINSFIAD